MFRLYRSTSQSLICLFSLAVLVLTSSTFVFAGAVGPDVLPARVRVLLMRLSPLMEKQDYLAVEQKIVELQKKSTLPEAAAMVHSVYHHPELYFVLGNCYLLQGLYPKAIKAYRKTVAGLPTHTYGWLNLAKAYYEIKEYPNAGECFARGYESAGKKNPETLYYSAASFLMAENYPRANGIFDQLQREHRQDFRPEWKEYWVHSLLAAERVEDGIVIICELIGLYAGEKRLQWQEILLHQYMQRPDNGTSALGYISELTEENPQVAKWWKAAAHIELGRNRYENGLAALIIYSYLTPLDKKEQQLLADLFLQVGIPLEAAPLYADHLREKEDPDILYRLAVAYDQLGQPEKSLQYLQGRKNNEGDCELNMLQGEICYRLHRYKEARLSFVKAADCKECKNGKAWLFAGYASLQMDDFSHGREAFVRAAQYKEEKKAAIKALAQLEKSALVFGEQQ